MSSLTPQQIADFKEAFSLFDLDGDGQIRKEDVAVVVRSLGYNPSEQELSQMVASIKSPQVDFQSFLDVTSARLKDVDVRAALIAAFRQFDRAKDGTISAAELRVVMQNMAEKLKADEIEDMINAAKPDKNGNINYANFVDLLTRK